MNGGSGTDTKAGGEAAVSLSEMDSILRDLDVLIAKGDPALILQETAAALGRALHVTRVAYGELDGSGEWLEVVSEWTNGVSSMIGVHPFPSDAAPVQIYLQGKPLVVEDMARLESATEEERRMSLDVQICAFVGVPLIRDGRVAALMTAHHKAPRAWADQEVRLIAAVASRLWSALDHARALARLRESEEQFRTLAENMPSICWLADAAGKLTWINRRGEDYFRATEEGVSDRRAICHPSELAYVEDKWRTALTHGTPLDMTVSLKGGDGTFRPFLTRAEPVRDGFGRVIRWCGVVTDLSEQRSREQRQAFLHTLGERIRDQANEAQAFDTISTLLAEHLGAEAARIRLPGQGIGSDLEAELRAGGWQPVIREQADDGARPRIVVPVQEEGRLALVLEVEGGEGRRWSEADVGLAWDVVERAWATSVRIRAEAELRQRDNDQAFLLRWSDSIRAEKMPRTILARTLFAVGEYLGVSRVNYAEADGSGESLHVVQDWTQGLDSVVGAVFPLEALGREVVREHLTGAYVQADDVACDPRFDGSDRGVYEAVGAAAFVSIPLVKDRQLLGVFSVQQSRPRAWSAREVRLMEDVAQRTWAVLERAYSEERLRESETLLAAFMENAPVGMYVKDDGGRYLRLNPQMEAVLGVPPGEALGRRARDILGEAVADRIEKADAAALGGAAQSDEIAIPGRQLYAHAMSIRFPIRPHAGERTRIGGFDIDITQRKQAEAALERSREALFQAEKLSALGSLLAGVSHELNNPLSIVVAQAVMMERQAEGSGLAERAVKIRRAADRCGRIVQTFLAMARQKRPERRECNLGTLVGTAVELAEYGLRSNGIAIDRHFDPALPTIMADADQLHQIVINLILNAQHAMAESPGPRLLTLRTGAGAEPGSVWLEVEDSGPGVPTDFRRRIFEPFFTTKPQGEGTGVGLSFSQGLAEAHGGRLELVDRGAGACFRLTLPSGEAAPALLAETSRGGEAAAPERTALVIDDEAEIGDSLADCLSLEGFRCDVVTGVPAARTLLQSRDYDLVVSDLRMPGEDGAAFYAWIRATRPELLGRLAFATGDTLGTSAARFLGEVERPVLEKPFAPDSVRRLLTQMGLR